MSGITIAKTTLEADAKAVAHIYQDRQETRINRLVHGDVEPSVFNAGLVKMFSQSLRDPDELFYVARDSQHNVVSYINLAKKTAVVPMTMEEREEARTNHEAAVMPGMNGPLLIEMWERFDRMAEQVMSGRGDFWMIDNVGTLQSHQGRGIASALIRTALEELCEAGGGLPMYLDTSGDEDGRAWPLYERMGFKRAGEFEIDLSKYGGQGVHRHFGMVKEPGRLSSDQGKVKSF